MSRNSESNHPELAETYNNLGLLFQAKGDFERAVEFYMKCLEIYKLHDIHPSHALVYQNLGELFLLNGDFDKSEGFLLECKQIRNLFCSTLYSDRAAIFKLLVRLYRAKGDLEKAEFYYRYPE
jgi:tetratricopeptide (TPR) repeat protein